MWSTKSGELARAKGGGHLGFLDTNSGLYYNILLQLSFKTSYI